jgi:hypothetical protein
MKNYLTCGEFSSFCKPKPLKRTYVKNNLKKHVTYRRIDKIFKCYFELYFEAKCDDPSYDKMNQEHDKIKYTINE